MEFQEVNQNHMYPSALVSRPHSITDVDVDHAPGNLPRQQAVADGEFVQAMLLGMLEVGEDSNDHQTSCQMEPVGCACLMDWDPEDFIEIKDFDGSAVSSTLSSENTCVPSMTFNGDYFDPEVWLRELAPSTQVQVPVSASRGSHQVVAQPPPSGSVGGSNPNNNKNPLAMKIVVSTSVVASIYIGGLNHTHPPAVASVEELPDVGAPKEKGMPLQRRPKRGRSSLQLEGRSPKVSRRFA